MVLFIYEKKDGAVYIPHLDILRAVVRTIRRAGLDVKYSEGFNPHMLLYFSPPIPVGISSECEQCAAVTDEPPERFMERYNAAAVNGLKILSAEFVQTANPAGDVKAAEYEIGFKGAGLLPFEKILKEKSLAAKWRDKEGGEAVKDIRGGIYRIESAGKDTLRCVLAAGNDNLRADRFIQAAAAYAGIDVSDINVVITRKKLYNKIPV